MLDRVLFLCYTGQLPEQLVLRSSFTWIAFRGSQILCDYVSVNHEPVLVHDRLKGVNNPDFFLFVVSDLFDGAGIDGAQIALQKFAEHTEAKVAFNDYLFDLILFGEKSELFKVRLAVTASKAPRSKEKQIAVKVGHYGVPKLVRAPSRGVYGHNYTRIVKKLRTNLSRLVKQITMQSNGR